MSDWNTFLKEKKRKEVLPEMPTLYDCNLRKTRLRIKENLS